MLSDAKWTLREVRNAHPSLAAALGCAWPYSASIEIEGDLPLIAVQNFFEVSMRKKYVSLEEWMCSFASQSLNPEVKKDVSMND